MDRAMYKIVLIIRKTRLDDLIRKYNTFEQAKFYVEHLGADFSDYIKEYKEYWKCVEKVKRICENKARVQVVDREHLPNIILGKQDIVIVLGQDGLVANTLKYTDNQPVIGVNPDPNRWDGVLLPFEQYELDRVIDSVILNEYDVKDVTMAQAVLLDGQSILAVNDLFVGRKTHASARYSIQICGRRENQSSSGIIISTGLGSTGWYKSIVTGAKRVSGIQNVETIASDWSLDKLYYTVREPYESKITDASIVFGIIEKGKELRIVSQMTESGTIFSDGMEDDAIEFSAGMEATISIAPQKGRLVVKN